MNVMVVGVADRSPACRPGLRFRQKHCTGCPSAAWKRYGSLWKWWSRVSGDGREWPLVAECRDQCETAL